MALISPLVLNVAGREYTGWTRVRIERSMDTACTQWGINGTRSWPGMEESWWLQPGDRVELRAYDQPVCVGHIDSIKASYDGRQHTIQIAGRGLAGDLIDCSYVGPPWQWKNVGAAEIIALAAKPYGIKVSIEADLGPPLDDFTVQQGETGWDMIDRICRLRQVTAYEEPDGTLLVTRGREAFVEQTLVQGQNIFAAAGELNDADRYSVYIVKGQQKAKNDEVSPEQASQSLGEVRDPSITRYRPLLLVQSANTDNGNALDRAKWEKQQRWGKARTAEITWPAWLMENGRLWPYNYQIQVEDAWMGLDRNLSITGVVFDCSNEGLRTILTLQPIEAWTPEPPDPGKTAKAKSAKKAGEPSGPDFWDQVAARRVQSDAVRREAKQ